jgi:hypothetical protein
MKPGDDSILMTTNHVSGAIHVCIAKMAYCFAVCEIGLEGFDGTAIRDLIKGRRHDFCNFVGACSTHEHLTDRYFHNLYLRNRPKYKTVLVHLFASFGIPPYEVVIGPV